MIKKILYILMPLLVIFIILIFYGNDPEKKLCLNYFFHNDGTYRQILGERTEILSDVIDCKNNDEYIIVLQQPNHKLCKVWFSSNFRNPQKFPKIVLKIGKLLIN